MATGAIVARILSQYNGAGTKAAKKDLLSLSKGFDRMAKKSAKAFGLAAAAGAAFAVKIGVDSVKAAISDEKSQALLANSLRNTTGANNEVIASVEKYIDSAQRALGITDDELRPAFAKLAGITGNVGHAQGLLGIAMDISAGASVDMAAATNAVIKATQGNFKALRGLGVQIDATTIKTKDVDAALKAAAKTFSGAASTRAETFEYRMKRVGIAFDEAKESLGIALMPTIESFFQLLTQKVIPAVQKFIEENGDKLVAAFQTAIKAIFGFAMVLYKTFDFVARNKDLFVALGIIFTATFVASKVIAFVTAIQALVKAYQAIRAAAIAATGAQAAATGGLSLTAAAAGIAAFAVTVGGLYYAVNKANKVMDKAAEAADGLEFSFDGLDKTTTDFLASLKGMKIDLKNGATATGKLTAEQLKLVQTQTTLAALKKLGVKPTTETDPLQLEAARINLVKQGNLAQDEGYRKLVESYNQMLANVGAAQKYADILQALADSKITSDEVAVLAAKWSMSEAAARLYIATIVAINDQVISAEEIAKLATEWGVTQKQASLYLDFFAALNDGKLSSKEIANLQTTWGFTGKAVTDYSAVFAAADDGKLTTAEIEGLATKWGLSYDAALDYIKKIASDFGFNTSNLDGPMDLKDAWLLAYGNAEAYAKLIATPITVDTSLLGPGDIAAKGWNAALAAATAYKNAIASDTYRKFNPPATPTELAYAEYLNGLQAAADKKAAEEAAAAKIIAQFADAASGDTYIRGRYGMSGMTSGNGGIPKLGKGGIVTSPTIAMIGEAGPEAVVPLSGSGFGGGITINIQGSVISEGDLVAQIRNAILQGQNSGLAITKSSVSI